MNEKCLMYIIYVLNEVETCQINLKKILINIYSLSFEEMLKMQIIIF